MHAKKKCAFSFEEEERALRDLKIYDNFDLFTPDLIVRQKQRRDNDEKGKDPRYIVKEMRYAE